jgi:putative DNA primase/helicase
MKPAAHVERIRNQLGPCVLLGIPLGQKGPRTRGWQKLTPSDMTPAYLESLNHGQNIGVLLGAASQGLCTIDADDDDLLESFLTLNPGLRESLISRGERGGNVWLRIAGDYPAGGKLSLAGKSWGEWRSDRNQTVFYGKHPTGRDYTNNGKRPLIIAFSAINWPDGISVPWKQSGSKTLRKSGEAGKDVFTPNDAGRAHRFVSQFSEEIRFVPERQIWLTWEGGRWQLDRDGAVERLAVKLSRELLREAAQIPGVDDEAAKKRVAASTEALAFGDRRNISDFLALAKVDQRILLSVSQLDNEPWLVGAKNAVIELKTGTVREYSRNDYITRTLACDVDPQATCPRWEQFMKEVFPDSDLRRYVHKAIGYTLTGDTSEQCFLFCYGTGHNGKSKFIETIEHVLGELSSRAGKGIVAASYRGDYPLRELADIVGARFILASETEEGERLNEGVIKDLTGPDSLRAEHKYERAFSFQAVGKLWIYGNHKPTIRGTDGGIWRRVRLLPFTEKFEGDRDDRNLGAKLRAEAAGILNWMVRGCLLWQKEGLKAPKAVATAVADYRAEEDTLADFLAECTADMPPGGSVAHSALFECYREWAVTNGLRYPLTSRLLARRLRERGQRDTKDSEGNRRWVGFQLKGNG